VAPTNQPALRLGNSASPRPPSRAAEPELRVGVIARTPYRSYQEVELCRTAFLIAWRALLREQRLTAKNMETLPGQLMTAVMLVSMTADSNAEHIAESALSRMEFYEREGRGELAIPLAH
jgi:hypothetical protein